MTASFFIVWALVAVLLVIAARRSRETVKQAGGIALNQARVLVLRMPLAILFGGFLVEIVPPEAMQAAMGPETGITGVVVASVAGALLPGGPFISFPIAVAFAKAGAGAPQLMALITGWTIWAIHRTLNFEFPMMGPRFVALRLATSFIFPPFAGIACMVAMNWIDLPPVH
jgi:uncharacterized membrane protein YraQ (UPF0718 family)